ncbi:uncharacterized protein EI97DRAFT_429773 [Westerdykella ornata]|uniref:UBA domain-containing protein n=1 Tax=Westerdykella ornata TaxID=318751 RepID=A0A6A6JTV7_WESOR|nr:uncharacterized protein EI97DRAFT_429773 [Westerdykella ornata]KAF2280012.1 hypothetical protein EI97DRAFT_429773 [Westerdykella ornata]
MDDIAGLDWSTPSNPASTANNTPAFSALRQTQTPQQSGRSTPLSTQQSGAGAAFKPFKGPSKPATPANDSFAGLVNFGASKSANSKLSLQERQRQLQEEKRKAEEERRKQDGTRFGAVDSQFWDTLGSGRSTPAQSAGTRQPAQNTPRDTLHAPLNNRNAATNRSVSPLESEDDILAAFNSAAPVDSSSHYPPPTTLGNDRSSQPSPFEAPIPDTQTTRTTSINVAEDDDDIFGLKQLSGTQQPPVQPTSSTFDGDDDILGLLGKPVSDLPPRPDPRTEDREGARSEPPDLVNPQAKAVAELVDMGFPADKAAIALATTESGLDVQAAVGYLLNQAHADAKQKSKEHHREMPLQTSDDLDEPIRRPSGRSELRDAKGGASIPAWARGEDQRSRSGQRRPEGQSSQEKDVAQYASEIGSSLFKSANSLWKTGRKQVQKAVAEFQQDADPNVPKWMRNADAGERSSGKQRADAPSKPTPSVTDEAMMLESGGRPTKSARRTEMQRTSDRIPTNPWERDNARERLPDRTSSNSPSLRRPDPSTDRRPATRLTREAVEEQSAQGYISPARRKKASPSPNPLNENQALPARPAAHRPTPPQSNNPFLQASATPKSRSPAVTPPPPKPKAPPRQIPPVSSSALNSSALHRQKGTEAFKRGDYSAAHAAYSSALSPLPSTHPITIVVLCNRAVTNLKVGDPKAAVSDADAALVIIGETKGEGEKIDLGATEGVKDMKEFYGKALMRKAEALEHMEKWADAGKVWRAAVEAGVGGSVSIQGRNRCDKAAAGGDKAAAPAAPKRPPVRKPPAPKPSALADLGGASEPDSEAVRKLKEANAAAEKADDEKFALTDQVDAKLVAWKGTKADNLRALLGSLDKVLWPEAGWNKVNMSDLVLPNKVKIVYMKAIAKVHPDKISQSATTEQKMLSAAVFATLNEAWDKFKTENGM